MRLLALISLCAGLGGSFWAVAELNNALIIGRTAAVLQVRDQYLQDLVAYDKLLKSGVANGPLRPLLESSRPLLEPFLKLPRAEAERLALLLGDELYERRRVTVPLALLHLILSWLLLTGALGTLRRQPWAVSMWSWACMVNIPFSLLSMLVTFVHSHRLLAHLRQPVAEALAKISGRSLALESLGLDQLTRLYVGSQAAKLGLWVLLLGGTTLYLQRYTFENGER